MKKFRLAIVGCGRIAYRHMEAIEANPRAELVALCDLNLERAEERRQQMQVSLPIYRDYREMLSKEDIDIVCMMTPSGMHPEHAIEIMENFGKHVILEKPVAMRVEDGEKMIEVSKKTGCRVFPVHQNRFNKAIQKIKEGMDSGIFGKISLATVRIRLSREVRLFRRRQCAGRRGRWRSIRCSTSTACR